MPASPVAFFSFLTRACISDDNDGRSRAGIFATTLLSFALGIAASGFTGMVLASVRL